MSLLILSQAAPAAAPGGGGGGGDLEITSTSGTLTHGSTLTINGSGFLTHADYGGAQPFLCRGFNDFSSSLEAGNFEQDGFDPENCNLSTSSPLGGAAGQFYRKTNEGSGQQGSIAMIHSGSTGIFTTSLWYRESVSSPELGHAACTKYLRHYMADAGDFPAYNWYFGPGPYPNGWENTTGMGAIFGHNGRYNGSAAGDVFHAQNVWRFMEVIEMFGTASSDGSEIFGSADYMEHRLSNVRLMRRGSGLASNAITAEGSDANENQRWVASAGVGTADGHDTSFGSHLCDTEAAGAFMDFADLFMNYGLQFVRIGAASTYAACTGFFEQIALTWSDTQITAQLNRGNLTLAGSYLYVRNSDGQYNSAGFAL